jgi:COMPASS component SWD2
MAATLSQLDDGIVRGMAIGAVFTDYVSPVAPTPDPALANFALTVSHTNRWQAGKINCLDFHRKDDLLVTSSEDDSIRLYNTSSAT